MGENGVSEIYVIKRNGRGREQLNIDKIHDMVEYACEDIKSVSASQVEMNSGLQFYDNIHNWKTISGPNFVANSCSFQ